MIHQLNLASKGQILLASTLLPTTPALYTPGFLNDLEMDAVSVYVFVMCVCVCVCLRERERESKMDRERAFLCEHLN